MACPATARCGMVAVRRCGEVPTGPDIVDGPTHTPAHPSPSIRQPLRTRTLPVEHAPRGGSDSPSASARASPATASIPPDAPIPPGRTPGSDFDCPACAAVRASPIRRGPHIAGRPPIHETGRPPIHETPRTRQTYPRLWCRRPSFAARQAADTRAVSLSSPSHPHTRWPPRDRSDSSGRSGWAARGNRIRIGSCVAVNQGAEFITQ